MLYQLSYSRAARRRCRARPARCQERAACMRHTAQMASRLALLALLVALLGCKERQPFPYVRLEDPAPATLAQPAHDAALVVFWGSWCPPCVEEAPSLQRLTKSPPNGLTIVVVAVNEPSAPARRTFPDAHRILDDPDGDLADQLRADVLPAAFLVKGDRLLARFDGARDWHSSPARETLQRLAASLPAH